MLLSRFWYVILGLVLGALTGGVFLATSIYNNSNRELMDQALAEDTQVVRWYMNDDARRRSSMLLKVCLDPTIRKQLHKASVKVGAEDNKIPEELQQKTQKGLKKLLDEMPEESRFTSLFAVDQLGRVVGQVGFGQASGIQNFELGGYAVVADALHGWVRDDAWVLDNRIYLVVARPVEINTDLMPVGAIIGLRVVDTTYARRISRRSGAAVGFYAGENVTAKAAPERLGSKGANRKEGFDPAKLDSIVSDLKNLATDKVYQEKGKSKPKTLMGDVSVIYSKIPGEAWDLGAGYVVGRSASVVSDPIALLQQANDQDKAAVPWWLVILVVVLGGGLGLVFSIFEHTRPLHTLRVEAAQYAKGEMDLLQVSKFRGVYRKIASDLNDGAEKIAAKGGVPRKAADLESVLGPLPAKPEMSAFAFGADDGPASQNRPASVPQPAVPAPSSPGVKIPAPAPESKPKVPAPAIPAPIELKDAQSPGSSAPKIPPPSPEPSPALDDDDDEDETVVSAVPAEILEASRSGHQPKVSAPADDAQWRQVFDDFVRTKKECGEPVSGLTFAKFERTLRKNTDQLKKKTGCKSVKFSVYVKNGRAALKASPVRK